MNMIYTLEMYEISKLRCPLDKWFRSLDNYDSSKIYPYLNKLKKGKFGNCKRLKKSILWEITIDRGPGYRVYYIPYDKNFILFLIGGIKDSQDKDIETAENFANHFLEVYNETKQKLSRIYDRGPQEPFA